MKIKPEILIALAKLAPTGEVRYTLNGIYFNRQHAIASDGHLYLSCDLICNYEPFIAPIELFKGLKKSTKNNLNIVELVINENNSITLTQAGVTRIMQPINGDYPRFNISDAIYEDDGMAHYDLKLMAKLHTVLNIIEKTTHYVIPKGDRRAGVVKGSNFTAFIMPYRPIK